MNDTSILDAVAILKRGGIIAYPTEAVYGLGCDPFNEEALSRLMVLKGRSVEKGFILIADCFEKLQPLLGPVSPEQLQVALATWPGPYTWVFPANLDRLSKFIVGQHQTVAIRVSAHPLVRALCHEFGYPLISTSANLAAGPPLRTAEAVRVNFGQQLDYILEGETGGMANPTEIRDVLTGKILRV